jgi:hypothetical protein
MLTALPAAQAADITPPGTDPGPAGSFAWKGLNWQKRFWDGAPHYNRDFDPANVSNPDANGHVKLSITNPTGQAPVAAEMQSTREGFGYGTYTTTVEKNVSALQKEVVWGCLFTYDPNAAPGYTEIDLCEASAWGGGAAYGQSWPVEQGHGYWFDSTKPAGQGNNTINFLAPTSNILTHKMVWEPGKITFETYAGEGYVGPLIKRTVLEGATVPVPAKERIHFNLWVTGGGGGDAAHVKPESVTIRDFSFTPANTLAPTGGSVTTPVTDSAAPAPAPIQLTGKAVKSKSSKTTTLTWSGASTAMVDLIINGQKRTVLNSGTYVVQSKGGGASVYQVCNTTAGCSPKLTL